MNRSGLFKFANDLLDNLDAVGNNDDAGNGTADEAEAQNLTDVSLEDGGSKHQVMTSNPEEFEFYPHTTSSHLKMSAARLTRIPYKSTAEEADAQNLTDVSLEDGGSKHQLVTSNPEESSFRKNSTDSRASSGTSASAASSSQVPPFVTAGAVSDSTSAAGRSDEDRTEDGQGESVSSPRSGGGASRPASPTKSAGGGGSGGGSGGGAGVIRSLFSSSKDGGSSLEAQNDMLQKALEEANTEASSLRTVWNETRAKLEACRALLRSREKSYNEKLREKDKLIAEAREEQLEEHNMQLKVLRAQIDINMNEYELKELRAQIDGNMSEFEVGMQAKSDLIRHMQQEKAKHDESVAALESRILTLQQHLADVEDQKNEMIRQEQIVAETHSKKLRSLQEDFIQRQRELEKEKEAHSSTRESFVNRETSLEADNIEFTNALAKAQLELQEKSSEFARLQGENHWLRADHEALQGELTAAKATLKLERSQTEKAQQTARQKSQDLADAKAKHDRAVKDLEQKLQDASDELKKLQDKARSPKSGSVRPDENTISMQKRLKTMADHLLQKQSKLETAGMERASLVRQLEAARGEITSLQNQIQELQRDLDGDDDFDFGSGGSSSSKLPPPPAQSVAIGVRDQGGMRMRGGLSAASTSSYSHQRRGVRKLNVDLKSFPPLQRAVAVMDSIGAQLGTVLRRRPLARLGFLAYVLMLHLWVVFILYHYHNHDAPSIDSKPGDAPGDMS